MSPSVFVSKTSKLILVGLQLLTQFSAVGGAMLNLWASLSPAGKASAGYFSPSVSGSPCCVVKRVFAAQRCQWN